MARKSSFHKILDVVTVIFFCMSVIAIVGWTVGFSGLQKVFAISALAIMASSLFYAGANSKKVPDIPPPGIKRILSFIWFGISIALVTIDLSFVWQIYAPPVLPMAFFVFGAEICIFGVGTFFEK